MDGHAPGVAVVWKCRIHRIAFGYVLAFLLRARWVRAIVIEVCDAHEITPECIVAFQFRGAFARIDRAMVLRGGERITLAQFRDLRPSGDPRRPGRLHEVSAEARARADASGTRASVTQVDGERIIGVPGKDPYGTLQVTSVYIEANIVAIGHAELQSGAGTHLDRVVPGQPRDRLRQFLQPGIIRIAAVAHGRIGTKHDFETARHRTGRGRSG